ncbi:MAG: hydrolase 1, exosortase A system-associated, partial [Steroidobacteraceae bacterium]
MTAPIEELPFFFPCEGEELFAILAAPQKPASVGVLVIVGGPQYRVGCHRQFVHLARHLASRGMAAMRFDYRGVGDSTGDMRSFEDIDADVRAAVDEFLARCPYLRSIVLWGICGAATAACLYAGGDARISAVVLVNPWVRTEAGEARTRLRHYYADRLRDRAFWRKLFTGRVEPRAAFGSVLRAIRSALGRKRGVRAQAEAAEHLPLPERMARGLERFRGRILLVLSGNDYT